MGIFSKLKNSLTGGAKGDSEEQKSKFAPEEEKPLDLKFVERFTEGGGNFYYCLNESEAYQVLEQYAAENELPGFFICSEELYSASDYVSLPTTRENDGQFPAVLSTCEALIAFNGGIMIHSHLTGGRKLSDLPKHHVLFGYTKQIVNTLRDGMELINHRYRENRPNHISVIRAPHDEHVELAAADPNKDRNVLLILIENEA